MPTSSSVGVGAGREPRRARPSARRRARPRTPCTARTDRARRTARAARSGSSSTTTAGPVRDSSAGSRSSPGALRVARDRDRGRPEVQPDSLPRAPSSCGAASSIVNQPSAAGTRVLLTTVLPVASALASASVMMRAISSATVGRSSITPTTCPLDSTPASRRPSTSAGPQQHRRVGREHDLRPLQVAFRASSRGPRDHAAPRRARHLLERERVARPRAGAPVTASAVLELVDELGAQHAVRHAVDPRRDDGVGDACVPR